jgi:hypothetical protein
LTLDGFETSAPDQQSQGRRGRAHSSLSSSPPARGRPTCRVQEPTRAASRGDPIEGDLQRPWSPANGTEPHLANPRKRFHGRVSGPRANPYRTGHGRPLELPNNRSMRNPQSAICDPIDGGCGNLTLRHAEGRRGRVKNKSESSPRSPQTGPGSGARRMATPPRVHRTQEIPVVHT